VRGEKAEKGKKRCVKERYRGGGEEKTGWQSRDRRKSAIQGAEKDWVRKRVEECSAKKLKISLIPGPGNDRTGKGMPGSNQTLGGRTTRGRSV